MERAGGRFGKKRGNNFQNMVINMVIKLTLGTTFLPVQLRSRANFHFLVSTGEPTYEQIEHGRDRVYNQMPERK